jgi:DNA-binding NarL/FixJ family response regulator
MIRVFHCDDSASYRFLTRDLLEDDPDIEVVGEAENIDGAVTALGALRPDIVLLDLVDTDRDAVGELLAVAPEARVVVLSGYPRAYGERKHAGASGYVEKDASIEELRETVMRVARAGAPGT